MKLDTLLLDETHTESLTIWGITIAVLFVIMLIGMYRSFRFSRASNRQAKQRIQALPLADMLKRLRIPLSRYIRKSSDLEMERQTWACEHCPSPEACNRMLSGEDLDPDTFCPNSSELKELKSGRNLHSGVDGVHSH